MVKHISEKGERRFALQERESDREILGREHTGTIIYKKTSE